ncbi:MULTISPECIES: response regulator [Spirulina sp. CCY15215]|uniref:response regulator n=1 Tax=Spirulina sp. CCY15215 TaxID=2767591 RepID=UPI00195087E4|nr:response regulator [Spirulina major]
MNKQKKRKNDILVVDDHLDNVTLLMGLLREYGYEVRQVLSGRQALHVIQHDPPDLILLDIMMPEMDGYQVCEKLKNTPKTRHIPVIFLSALNDLSDKVKGFKLGGADYITKPFRVEEVLARVQHQTTILTQKKQLLAQNLRLQQEIKERQQAEMQLKQVNQELQRSNDDLEQFTSIVSHDLRQPLTTINGYASLLLMKYAGQFPGDAERFIRRISNAGERMEQMIEDLLFCAHIGGMDRSRFEQIEGDRLLDETLENLRSTIENTQAIIEREHLPIIFANPIQLRELLENLIANALKYCDRSPPQVKISARETATDICFSVQDNGIGIDPQSYEEIFQIFHRLHPDKHYSGTGIGLAICQKIVEAHGGRIWLDSQPCLGSTFYFTIPQQKVDNERVTNR